MSDVLDSLLVLSDTSPSPSPPSSPNQSPAAQVLPPNGFTAIAANTASVGDKRPADDDLLQYADVTGRRVRLRPAGQQELRAVARLSPDERVLWMAAQLLRSQERLEDVQPADPQWTMPRVLKDKIDMYSYLIILSPMIPCYVTKSTPAKRLTTLLERHPQWGYTSEVRNSPHKKEVVTKRIQERITDRRAELKQIIWQSLGPDMVPSSASAKTRAAAIKLDIAGLCENIAAKHSSNPVKVSLELCARMALLRLVLMEVLKEPTLSVKDYWDRVDERLEGIRGMFPNELQKITRLFMNILEGDKKEFGMATMPAARGASADTTPSPAQAVADDAADNFSGNLRED